MLLAEVLNGTAAWGKCLAFSTKAKHTHTMCPSNPIPEHIPGRNGRLCPLRRFMADFCIIATEWK